MDMYFKLFVLFLSFQRSTYALQAEQTLWKWQCNSENACVRLPANTPDPNATLYPSLEICRLVCGPYGGLWPQPTGLLTVLNNQLFYFKQSALKFVYPDQNNTIRTYLKEITTLFLDTMSIHDSESCSKPGNTLSVIFEVSSNNTELNWDTDESYKIGLNATGGKVSISAMTIFGARHGLETLSQLMEFDSTTNCQVMVDTGMVSDAPVYPHRGLLLDTARNFLSIGTIKKQIDGMAVSKLNVLHLHVTDSQSFPLEITSVPNMTKYGAYSNDKIYHHEDIKDLVSFAKLRGVRILLELDAPSHSGNGWQWGPDAGLGNLAVCINEQPWRSYCIQPPCGQLNPINNILYEIQKQIYGDIIKMVPSDIFHMGGDEVYIPCWNSTPEIIEYLGDRPRDLATFLDLWSDYQDKTLDAFDSVKKNTDTSIILWTSHLTDPSVIENYLPKNRYVIQTWVPAGETLPNELLNLGYRIIVSTKDAWYLDHGVWGSTTYHSWRVVYENKIPKDVGTLGGEVCMWAEYVDDSGVESRIWPRAAAAAERLWSNLDDTSKMVEQRFYRHRERLVSRGLKPEALIPRWCYQNEGEC